mmetsp:Transcript_14488/g.24087  ORF Transcript_14488/g.24087 Transcript_14488/m.24087 type:complete len:211 (-) Transcript_14488:220-852(-)|eukprot:CAMPEP_0174976048 /NCGR_PEP_ID=MMETSP0004_2-20121128/12801_1 /TAXON_ID=420556 /ORGANISM="Ochromonas sp., Strain CCMP1393" /LENGTH=210 /DNA_ID=CAMNT_0016227005 /DNA_START=66 /DNA_END=701 /DNA_ORIENTATION=+
MFVVTLACLIGTAAAFAPAARSSSRGMTTTMMAERSKSLPFMLKPAKLDGSLAGDEGFDPLGLSNIDDLGIDLYWMREAELKHARVAMLATVGLLSQELGFVLPGMPRTSNQIDALWELARKNAGPLASAIVFIGIVEIFSGLAITEGRKSGDRAPGDFGFNPLGMGKTTASANNLALKEIRNGRLAMWAAAGLLLQGSTTGEGAFANLF